MRTAKHEKAYRKYNRGSDQADCAFCSVDIGHTQFVDGTQHFKIIRNTFPYALWDSQGLTDHLMVVPRRHTDRLDNMTDAEKIEYVDILSQYEKRGYSFFARAPQSITKSITHQHTHVIKSDGRIKRFVLLLKKPLIRIVR